MKIINTKIVNESAFAVVEMSSSGSSKFVSPGFLRLIKLNADKLESLRNGEIKRVKNNSEVEILIEYDVNLASSKGEKSKYGISLNKLEQELKSI